MSKWTLVEQDEREGAYGMISQRMIVTDGKERVLLSDGYGGESTPNGGMYRWSHGVAVQLQPTDTLASIDAGEWSETVSLAEAIEGGYDPERPLLDWGGGATRNVASYVLGRKVA